MEMSLQTKLLLTETFVQAWMPENEKWNGYNTGGSADLVFVKNYDIIVDWEENSC